MTVAVVALASVLRLPETSALARHANPSIAAGAFASLTDAGPAELGLRLDRGARSGTRVVTMVTLVVRSGAVTFDRTHEIPCKQAG
jgi:hypothetical protein